MQPKSLPPDDEEETDNWPRRPSGTKDEDVLKEWRTSTDPSVVFQRHWHKMLLESPQPKDEPDE